MNTEFKSDLENLVLKRHYPCTAAVQSAAKKDYDVVTATSFGHGADRDKIREAIFKFIERWKDSRSTTYSLFVVYPDDQTHDEESFEASLWSELSSLTSVEERAADWAPGWSQDPGQKNFTLCIGGEAFFVVGLHPHSSRDARRFPYPTLIFNAFGQFQDLQAQGIYDAMVAKNRARDQIFQGSVNPMAEAHGESWETIQFSGKTNSKEWKCPFAFLSRKKK